MRRDSTAENRPVGQEVPDGVEELEPSRGKRLIKRFGVAGLIFFTVKGILWLLVPLGLFSWLGGC